jgi:hypothetical protein
MGKKAKRTEMTWELDCFHVPAAVRDAERPYFPLLLLCAEVETGLVVGQAMAGPAGHLSQFRQGFLETVESTSALPKEIRLRRADLHEAFLPVAEGLGVRLTRKKALPAFESARRALMKRFSHWR